MESRGEEEASRLDAIFQNIEDFLSKQRDQEQKFGWKEKCVIGNQKLVSVFTPEWRKAVIRFTEKIPMSDLIQGFQRFYNDKRRACRSASENYRKALVKGTKTEDGQLISLPYDVLTNIFVRLPLLDLLTSRLVSDDWAAVYDCKYFQAQCNRNSRAACIVINNHNLDMWAFSVLSRTWFLMKVPCDWDRLGLKTLGIKASCKGLILVARSDFTLYVVNPITAQCKSLPDIYPDTSNRIDLLNCFIVHGTAQMQTANNRGHYTVYLFGNCENLLRLARYNSETNRWTIKKVGLSLNNDPIVSTTFPSPLSSYWHGTIIVCFSATFRLLMYSCDSQENNDDNARYAIAEFGEAMFMGIPTSDIETKTCYNHGSLPTLVSCRNRPILVGRVKGNDKSQIYGRLPIVRHSKIGLWKFDEIIMQWSMIDIIPLTIKVELMIETSEGTDFLVVGNGYDSIRLMLKGSDCMLHYKLRTKEWELERGCPGGGYMDANLRWKSVYELLGFDQVSPEE